MDISTVYCTCPDADTAQHIGQTLVEDRLAACATIVPTVRSLYIWDDKLCDEAESVLLLKIRRDRYDEVETAIKALHPYDIPCIVSYPIDQVSPEFHDWVVMQ
jgi:periplasmic divalent cation tolerance protein